MKSHTALCALPFGLSTATSQPSDVDSSRQTRRRKPNTDTKILGFRNIVALGVVGAAFTLVGCQSAQSIPSTSLISSARAASMHPSALYKAKTISRSFVTPDAVAVDGKGNIYVTDYDGGAYVLASKPDGGWKPPAPIGSGFSHPNGVAVDSGGNVYVADSGNFELKVVSPPFTGPTHGTTAVIFNDHFGYEPYGVAVSASRTVFFSSTVTSQYVALIKPTKNGGWSVPKQVGVNYGNPIGVALGAGSAVYVADAGSNAVVKIQPPFVGASFGRVTSIGSGFSGPFGVAVNSTCKKNCPIYVADTNNNRIAVFAQHVVTTINAKVLGPKGVAVDAKGELFVADTGHHAIVELTP